MGKNTKKSNVSKIDAALEFARGNFVAAAKLIDLTPLQLKSIVQYRTELKQKWGKKKPGRPPERLSFTIRPFEPAPVTLFSDALQDARLVELIQRIGKPQAKMILEQYARGNALSNPEENDRNS